jgi:hypothetical protein
LLLRVLGRCAAIALSLPLALAACAHAPPPAPASSPEPLVWPEPPAEPRVRLALVIATPLGAEPKRSLWQRAWRAFVGLDAEHEDRPRFQRPFGVASTDDGGLVVADPDAAMVVRMRAGAPSLPLLCPDQTWGAPIGVAVSERGDVYVADAAEAVVVRIGADGRCARMGAGTLERPTGLAARGGKVYVADPPRHHVVVLSDSGALLATMGAHGDDEGGLNFPTAVALDPAGNLLVVDALNFRVARFAPDGRWLGAFGASLEDGGPFAMPKGIATDPEGRIYVSDAQRDVVVVFHPDGTLDYALGDSGEAPGRFTHPAGVASARGRVYVADSYARRVQAFEIIGAQR